MDNPNAKPKGKVIKHINADVLSDEELTILGNKLDRAERRMDEKILGEIDHRNRYGDVTESGIWLPGKR